MSTDSSSENHRLAEKLIKTKDQRKNIQRELTGHIVTRWYRAPEIILLEKDYGPAIDMWGFGCIVGELFAMFKENSATFLDRKPLFPGKSCFPLSPEQNPQKVINGFPVASGDQLSVIFSLIGTPNVEDKSFVTDTKALEYLETFQYIPRADLQSKFPGCSKDAIDFLNRLLVFNPHFRMTLEEAIQHPFLDAVRQKTSKLVPSHIDF